MFDVDDFKQINDRYGHIQGDLCLAGIAECIKKSYANFGYCYRIGGDEFCVLLKNGGNEGRCKQEFLQRLHFYLRYPMDQPRFPERILLRLKTELTRICINIKKNVRIGKDYPKKSLY